MQSTKVRSFLQRKPVKITGIVLLSLLALVAILLSAASIYVHYNKDKIIAKVKEAFNKRVNGEISIGDIDLSVWKNFPNIAIDIQNLSVSDSLHHKPLLKANQISFAVSLFQLASTKPDVARVKISGGLLHLLVDSTGFNNAYLLSPKKDTATVDTAASSSQPIIIRHVDLDNFQFLSEDLVKHKRYSVKVSTATATIDRQDSLLLIGFKEECLVEGLGFNLDKGAYVEHTTIKAKWQIQFDKNAKTLTVLQSPVVINDNNFHISAEFHFKDSSWFKLHAFADNILYKDARALLTQRIQGKLKFIDITSPIQVDARLTGPLAHGGDPFVYVVCQTANNIVLTPVANFTDCNFRGIYDNRVDSTKPPSDPNSIVFFPQFTGKWSNVPMQGDSIRIDDLSNPVLFFNFRANCSFQQLDEALNLQTVSFDEGAGQLNLQYKGALTADPAMLANVKGALHVEKGKITYVPHNLQFENCNGDLEFSRNNIFIKKITCNYKKNYFEVTGAGNDMNRLTMTDSGKSSITCNIFCPSFNASDFKTVFVKPASRKTVRKKQSLGNTMAGIDNILQKGDMQVNITAKELQLDNFSAQNARVSLLLREDEWEIKRASLNFDGGSFMIDAVLRSPGNTFAGTAHLAINNADVRKAFYAFNNFGQDGIEYNNLRGTLNTNATLDMKLDSKGGIVPGSLAGTASFSITNGSLINFQPVIAIQEYALKNRDLTNITFAEIKNTLTIKNNQVIIPRMEIASTAMRIFVEGVYGVMKAPTDISIQVPLSNLSNNDKNKKAENKGLNARVGPSIYLRARNKNDGKIKIGLDLFRKFRKDNVDTTGTH